MLDVVFKGIKDGAYTYCADQVPIVCIDIVDPVVRLFKKCNIKIDVTSFDKQVSFSQTVDRTVFGNCDTLEFYFDELTAGNYLVTATLKADDNVIVRTVPLTVLTDNCKNPANEYNRRLELGFACDTGFSNSTATVTPGINRVKEYRGKVETNLEIDPKTSLINTANAQFVFENDRYAYAINKDNTEVIAYKENGGYIDVLAGGGKFVIRDCENNVVASTGEMLTFSAEKDSVTVVYKVLSDDSNAVCFTRYTFYENSIGVALTIKCKSDKTIKHDSSRVERVFINQPVDHFANLNFNWVYPPNNDYPYRYTEAWIVSETIDKNHRIFTYNRGDIPLRLWNFGERGASNNLITYFEPTENLDYTYYYDLVLADHNRDTDTSYVSLFEGKQSDFAAGITPVTENDDDTSLFVGDSVDLNLNIKNFVKDDIAVSIRYDLRDYYGNVLDAGEFIGQKINSRCDINRVLHIDSKVTGYGMYFVNLTVRSSKYTYREYYPLALFNEHTYKYNATSPFSIGQFLNEAYLPFKLNCSIAKKVGIAAVRCAFFANDGGDYNKYLKMLRDDGVKILGSGATEEKIVKYGENFDECLYGNEINLASFWAGVPIEERFELYYNDYFLPLRANCDKYGKRLVTAGISAAQTEWFDAIYNKGIWDKIDKFSVHVYGIPYSPECEEKLDDMWSTEGGLIRTVKALEKYGKKPFQVNEMGYHTGHYDSCVCLRTQADYNIRSQVLCAAYGAEYAAAYGMYDFSGAGVGTSMSDNEHHFGHFYMPDCFGRILPKPSGVTFGFFTRTMESTQSVSINERLTKGNVRAFTACTKEHGDVIIAWSNCAKLPNDRGDVENCSYFNTARREPTMPWQNQWKETEWVWFDTDNESVTLVDCMGKKTEYPAHLGKVRVPLNGEVVCIIGVKP